jgi:hypothetical protein
MPHLNNVVFTRIAQVTGWATKPSRVTHGFAGVYDVISTLLLIKFAVALLMLFAGDSASLLLILFIAGNRIFTEVNALSPHSAI